MLSFGNFPTVDQKSMDSNFRWKSSNGFRVKAKPICISFEFVIVSTCD